MKSYREIANSVFERRDRYEIEKKRKIKTITRTLTPVLCLCLVAVIGFGAWQRKQQPAQTLDDTVYPGMKDNFDEKNGESPSNPQANNKIVINHIDSLSAEREKSIWALMIDDYVEMSKSELNDYYGINLFPTVPKDIKEWNDVKYGIYKRNGGTGEVYWDGLILNYDNEDFTRSINIEIKKGSLPILDYGFGDTIEEKSVINNWEIALAISESGSYHAIFMYKNVGFCVNAKGLTQDEFVAVLSSIII